MKPFEASVSDANRVQVNMWALKCSSCNSQSDILQIKRLDVTVCTFSFFVQHSTSGNTITCDVPRVRLTEQQV